MLDPRVLGTVAAFELDAAGMGYLDPVGRELAAFAAGEGVLLRPLGNTVYLLPPYCITPGELEAVYGRGAALPGDAMIRLGVTGTDTGVGKTLVPPCCCG